jgi:hypothetical protein
VPAQTKDAVSKRSRAEEHVQECTYVVTEWTSKEVLATLQVTHGTGSLSTLFANRLLKGLVFEDGLLPLAVRGRQGEAMWGTLHHSKGAFESPHFNNHHLQPSGPSTDGCMRVVFWTTMCACDACVRACPPHGPPSLSLLLLISFLHPYPPGCGCNVWATINPFPTPTRRSSAFLR